MCLCECITHVWVPEGQKKMSYPLEWMLEAVVSCLTWILRTEPVSSVRSTHSLNHWALVPPWAMPFYIVSISLISLYSSLLTTLGFVFFKCGHTMHVRGNLILISDFYFLMIRTINNISYAHGFLHILFIRKSFALFFEKWSIVDFCCKRPLVCSSYSALK